MTDVPAHGEPTSLPSRSVRQTVSNLGSLSRERSDPSTQRTEPSQEDESSGENDRRAFRDKLSSFISGYRENKFSKSRAIAKISAFIDDAPALSEPEKEKALDLYVEELNSFNTD